mmetsp:Transcript_110357/g.213717  ORF Transcript_110357/g.213717 Transcript_110357/m.213717 type:complete len:449 (-) Transcript_110357:123-1469(-)
MRLTFGACLLGLACGQPLRNVRINGQKFMLTKTGAEIVMGGPNVVVKGPPYMPEVTGNTICNDVVNDACMKIGTCTTCSTFNQADIDHMKSRGWNFIRLGVVWAGAQPRNEDALDPDFLRRLHAVLNLTDANGIHVMLDNHGDMVGSAGCGNGVPMWFQKKAAPEHIGMPLETPFPYKLVDLPGFGTLDVEKLSGYSHCGKNLTKWQQYAGDPNYNLLNECCQAMNSGNPGGLGFTVVNHLTMNYVVSPGKGRDYFVRFWKLIAEAVKDHPSAFAAELMNEPMSIRRRWMFDTWRACAEAINGVIPDMSVSIADVGEGSVLPSWVSKFTGGDEDISKETVDWIKNANTVFYAWHYGDIPTDINNMKALSKEWNVPTFGTELGCSHWDAAKAANISHSYWHYSAYCTTGPGFGNRKVPEDTFGGCILGWGGGNSSACSPDIPSLQPIVL